MLVPPVVSCVITQLKQELPRDLSTALHAAHASYSSLNALIIMGWEFISASMSVQSAASWFWVSKTFPNKLNTSYMHFRQSGQNTGSNLPRRLWPVSVPVVFQVVLILRKKKKKSGKFGKYKSLLLEKSNDSFRSICQGLWYGFRKYKAI